MKTNGFEGEIIPKVPVWDRPFYWTAVNDPLSAPSGWYQWVPKRGLVYLGASILDRSNAGACALESGPADSGKGRPSLLTDGQEKV
jgi:hypothetical protein